MVYESSCFVSLVLNRLIRVTQFTLVLPPFQNTSFLDTSALENTAFDAPPPPWSPEYASLPLTSSKSSSFILGVFLAVRWRKSAISALLQGYALCPPQGFQQYDPVKLFCPLDR